MRRVRERVSVGKRHVWVRDGIFMHKMLKVLQHELDQTDNDIRLIYRQRYSFPKKFRCVVLEFPDGVARETVEELDMVSGELLSAFTGSRAFKKTVSLLYWYSEDARNVATSVEISYALAEECGRKGLPGVVVYWEK